MAVLAGTGSLVGSRIMKDKISSAQLKRFIGVLLWLVAAKITWDLAG